MTQAARNRVRWRCRRGMLELDVLLANWLARHGLDLGADELAALERLLEHEDVELHAWLTRRAAPADPGLGALIERILASAGGDAAPA